MIILIDYKFTTARIHAQGNFAKGHNHPDSRAIMFESKTYSKRKIADFINALQGFEEASKIVDLFTGTKYLLHCFSALEIFMNFNYDFLYAFLYDLHFQK